MGNQRACSTVLLTCVSPRSLTPRPGCTGFCVWPSSRCTGLGALGVQGFRLLSVSTRLDAGGLRGRGGCTTDMSKKPGTQEMAPPVISENLNFVGPQGLQISIPGFRDCFERCSLPQTTIMEQTRFPNSCLFGAFGRCSFAFNWHIHTSQKQKCI